MSETEATTETKTFDNTLDAVMHAINGPVGTTSVCQPDEFAAMLGAPTTTFTHVEGDRLHAADNYGEEATNTFKDLAWAVGQQAIDQDVRVLPEGPEGFFSDELRTAFTDGWANYDLEQAALRDEEDED